MKKYDLSRLTKTQVIKKLKEMQPLDIALYLETLTPAKQVEIIELLPVHKVDDVFIELEDETRDFYFTFLTKPQKEKLLSHFELDELKNFYEESDEENKHIILSCLTEHRKEQVLKLLSYDEEEAGSMISVDYIKLQGMSNAGEATNFLINHVLENDFIDDLYVTDDDQKYLGQIKLIELISARKNEQLEHITNYNQVVYEHDSIYLTMKKFRNYDQKSMAVLDSEDKLLGIITADDILDFMVDSYEDDIDKMTSVGDFEEDSSVLTRVKLRMPWLFASIALNIVIASFLSVFEHTLTEVVALILFQPMILGMAGNIGTQSIAVTILGIHQSRLETKQLLRKHIIKEISIGIMNSIIIGILGLLISFIVFSVIKMGHHNAFELATVIGLSLFGGMFISSIAGVFIPIVLNKFSIDPALASGPIISSVNDLFALLIYFSIATLMLL